MCAEPNGSARVRFGSGEGADMDWVTMALVSLIVGLIGFFAGRELHRRRTHVLQIL